MKEEIKVVLPTVNPNGTAKSKLIDLYDEAYRHLSKAYYSIKLSCKPKDCDYPKPWSINDAVKQHDDLVRKIESLMSILEKIAVGIYYQNDNE